jgi:hypothetical protein
MSVAVGHEVFMYEISKVGIKNMSSAPQQQKGPFYILVRVPDGYLVNKVSHLYEPAYVVLTSTFEYWHGKFSKRSQFTRKLSMVSTSLQ